MATQRQLKDKENFEQAKQEFDKHIENLATMVFSPNPDAKKIHEILHDNLLQYSKLHAPYSEYNTNWLNNQMREKYARNEVNSPFLTFPANFKHWSSLTNDKGESVRVKAGAKALLVLKPKIIKEKLDNDKEKSEEIVENNIADKNTMDAKKDVFIEKVVGFIPIKVFDVSQTNAIEIGAIKPIDWSTISQNDTVRNQAYEKTIDYLSKVIPSKYDVNVVFDNNERLQGGSTLGYISFGEKTIYVQNNLPSDIKLGVLAHELGHYLCEHDKNRISKDMKEMQAEAFSYLLTAKMGIDTTLHIDYIQNHFLKEVNKSYSDLISGDLNDKSHLNSLRKAFNHIMDSLKEPYKNFYEKAKFGTFLEKEIAPLLSNTGGYKEKVSTNIKETNNDDIKLKV